MPIPWLSAATPTVGLGSEFRISDLPGGAGNAAVTGLYGWASRGEAAIGPISALGLPVKACQLQMLAELRRAMNLCGASAPVDDERHEKH